ncbi:hypothetical protein PKHYL_06420 [Psychrobacter sp. KH172YL61]|nr:hypothetical protein PKHYL_06420 [Psychrobacter sp. KH172YL61]
MRDGQTRFNAQHISSAIDGNLERLQTDYIDIYQLHWPERQANFFGQRGYTEDMAAQSLDDLTPFLETIQALNDEIKKVAFVLMVYQTIRHGDSCAIYGKRTKMA